jgi:uncharacterized protein (TIGR00369 family)
MLIFMMQENQIDSGFETGGFLPTYKGCIICGDKASNPHTLNLRFRLTKNGVETSYTPDSKQEGYMNIVHGGITSALLDETIGWACAYARKRYFVTVELNMRFLKPLPVGTSVVVSGRATSHSSRFSEGEGEIKGADGTIYVRAKAKYFLLPEIDSKCVHDYLTFKKDDIDVLK